MRTVALAAALLVAACEGATHYGGSGGAPVGDACNGLDDDWNGVVDDGCSCLPGTSQACWPGPPNQRGLGECRDGVQVCVGVDEFSTWGPCEDAVLASDDVVGDGIDQDCSGSDGPAWVPPPATGTNCGSDEDDCTNGHDDDCDGATDCDDLECRHVLGVCCATVEECACTEVCTPGKMRWCDSPTACSWAQQYCNPDATWGACTETQDTPLGCDDVVFYDVACCLDAVDACCQDAPNPWSLGDCEGVVECVD